MKGRVSIILSILIGLIIVTAGCTQKKIPDFRERPPLTPEEVLEKISRAEGYTTLVKAEAYITLDSPDRKYSGRVVLALRQPSFLRMDAVPVFGPADFLFSANEEEFKVFIPGIKKFYIGETTGENFFRFFGISLPVDEAVSILTGAPPERSGDQLNVVGYWEGTLYRIDIIAEDKRIQSIWTAPDGKKMVRIEVLNKYGRILYNAWFEDYTGTGGYPKKIKVAMEVPEKALFKVRYSDIEVSSDDDISLFDLSPPPGIESTVID